MEYNFGFQMLATDLVKIERASLGRHFRVLVICSCVPMLAFGLNYIFTGENTLLGVFMVGTALPNIFNRWLLYPLCLALRSTDASVKLDGQNLTSTLGTRSYDIPWGYFLRHGTLLDEGDHFYFKSKLGNIYLPKRAFDGGNKMDGFLNDLSEALGERCLIGHEVMATSA